MRTGKMVAIMILAAASRLSAQQNARSALISADADLSDSIYSDGIGTRLPDALGSAGIVLWPGAGVIQGTANGRAFFGRQEQLAGAKFSWQPFRIELAPDSSLAIVTGVVVIDKPAARSSPVLARIGRYLAAWERVDGRWRLSAICVANLLTSAEATAANSPGQVEMSLLRSIGRAGAFVAADSAFAADAGAFGAKDAFMKWAAPDATTFAQTGELNVGPARIGAPFTGGTAHWVWGAVAAGSSADGMLGWTVGQATITPANGGEPNKSKYLTLWRKMPDGTIRFIADGGNARP